MQARDGHHPRCSELELEPTPRTEDKPPHDGRVDIDGEEVPFGKVSVKVRSGGCSDPTGGRTDGQDPIDLSASHVV